MHLSYQAINMPWPFHSLLIRLSSSRVLVSFPTRRSSDLRADLLAMLSDHADLDPVDKDFQHLFRSRSEEHTSELQSPCNLVCRPLLEQKNSGQPSDTPLWSGNKSAMTL